MVHSIREHHLEDICVNCKQPHGGEIELLHQHHKIYEVITCINCGYKIIKVKDEKQFSDRLNYI